MTTYYTEHYDSWLKCYFIAIRCSRGLIEYRMTEYKGFRIEDTHCRTAHLQPLDENNLHPYMSHRAKRQRGFKCG